MKVYMNGTNPRQRLVYQGDMAERVSAIGPYSPPPSPMKALLLRLSQFLTVPLHPFKVVCRKGGRDMARKVNKLTQYEVATISERGYYGDGNGLWLQVSEWGTKAWIFRYQRF